MRGLTEEGNDGAALLPRPKRLTTLAVKKRTLSRLSSRKLPGPREAASTDSDDEDAERWRRVQKAHSPLQLAASGRFSMLSKAGALSRRQSTLSTASAGARAAPGAGKATDPDSEHEQWARMNAAAVSRTTSLFKPVTASSALLQRRLSAVSTASHGAAMPPARAKPSGESDSDDEAWAKASMARRASAAASAAALPMSRAASLKVQAPLFRRASAAAAAAADRSEDSDEEHLQRAQGAKARHWQSWAPGAAAQDAQGAKRRAASISALASTSAAAAQQRPAPQNRRASMPAFTTGAQTTYWSGPGAAGNTNAMRDSRCLSLGGAGLHAWQPAPLQQQQQLLPGRPAGRLEVPAAQSEHSGFGRLTAAAYAPAVMSAPASQQGSQRSHHDGQQRLRTQSAEYPDIAAAAQLGSGSIPASVHSSMRHEEHPLAAWQAQGQRRGSMPPDMHTSGEYAAVLQRVEDTGWQPAAVHSPRQSLAPPPRMSTAVLPQQYQQGKLMTEEEEHTRHAGHPVFFPGRPHVSNMVPHHVMPAATVGEQQVHQGRPASPSPNQDDRSRATETPSAQLHVDQRRMESSVFQAPPAQEAQPPTAPLAQAERRATQMPSAPPYEGQHRMSTRVPTQEATPSGILSAQAEGRRATAVEPEAASPQEHVDQRRMTSPPSLLRSGQSFAFGEPLRSIPEHSLSGMMHASEHQLSLSATEAALERRSTSVSDMAREPLFGFSRAPIVQLQQVITPAFSAQGSKRPSFATADLMRPPQRRSEPEGPHQPAITRMPQGAPRAPEQATSGHATPAREHRGHYADGDAQLQQSAAPQVFGSQQGSLDRQLWADFPGSRGSVRQIITGARSITDPAILAGALHGLPDQALGTGQATQGGMMTPRPASRRASTAAASRQHGTPAVQAWQQPDQAAGARRTQGALSAVEAAAQPDSVAIGYQGAADVAQPWQGQLGAEAADAERAYLAAAGSTDAARPWAPAPDQAQGFTVYENELADGAEAAEQVMRLATSQQPLQDADNRGALQPLGLDREALEAAIITAVHSSVSGTFASLRTNVQQLDARLDTWWSQNDQANQGLRLEIAELRRGTADSIHTVSQRMDNLEAVQKEAAAQAASRADQASELAQAPVQSAGSPEPARAVTPGDDLTSSIAAAAKAPAFPAHVQQQADPSRGAGQAPAALPAGSSSAPAGVRMESSSGDGGLTVEVLQRLDDLEALIGGQLDQLSAHHGERIAAIKGGLRTSVNEAAAVARSLPSSPIRGAASSLPPSPARARPATAAAAQLPDGRNSPAPPPHGASRAWADALLSSCTCEEHRPRSGGVWPAQEAGAGTSGGRHEALLRRFGRLEASHRALLAGDRSKAKLAAADAVGAAALDRRLEHIEERLHCCACEAAAATTTARSARTSVAAAEWRIEKVATTCAATVKAVSAKQARLSGEVGKAQQAAGLADAKCTALGAELAQLWRDSGRKRLPSEALARRLQRIPKVCCPGATVS